MLSINLRLEIRGQAENITQGRRATLRNQQKLLLDLGRTPYKHPKKLILFLDHQQKHRKVLYLE